MLRHVPVLLALLLTLLSGVPQAPIAAALDPAGWRIAAARAQAAPANSITITNRSGVAQTGYPLQFGRPFLPGAIPDQPQALLNGVAQPTQADVKNRWPDGSVKFAVIAVVVPTLPAGGSLSLTFRDQRAVSAPLTTAQMLASMYNFVAFVNFKSPTTGVTQTASARQMLQNGDYKLWTSGPVAQTIILGDDSAGRKYDIGFGDGHRPLRPRFYATFWPATHQVAIRVAVENGLTTELEDVAYTASVKAGPTAPGGTPGAGSYSVNLTGAQASTPRLHWAMTSWTKVFWLNGAPDPRVDIDYNLAYLVSTRFIPSFDTGLVIPDSAVAAYDALWIGSPHDIYDGAWDGGQWQNAMATAGGRMEIGPYPAWNVAWLYTGDWRLRRMSLGMADLAGAFPANLREAAAGKRLSRYDAAGSSSGLGHVVAPTDRLAISAFTTSLLLDCGASCPVVVGPINPNPPWSYNTAHEPAPFYIPYLMTGDPWYLNEMYMWAGFDVIAPGGGTGNNSTRGPTGAEGAIYGETRALGWELRSRADTAFIAPDADPEKAYFTYMTNDALARWEGNAGITGTAYQTAPPVPNSTLNMWQWGRLTGNHQSGYPIPGDPVAGKVGPLHMWPAGDGSTTNEGTPAGLFTTDVEASMQPWMQNYFTFGVARARELGFAAGPLFSFNAVFNMGVTLDSGLPIMNGLIDMPAVSKATGDWYKNWPAVAAALWPGYRNGSSTTVFPGGLPGYYASQGYSESYEAAAHAVAALALGEPRGDRNWAWHKANDPGITNNAPYSPDPRWAFVPRTDANVLPAIPPN